MSLYIIILAVLFIFFLITSITLFQSKQKTIVKIRDKDEDLLTFDKIKMKTHDKKNILVIQNGSYVKYPEYSEYSIKINKIYCKKWGYDYIFIKHELDKMPPYWLKVYDMNIYLNQNKYDYIIYLDLDAVFFNQDYSLENIINEVDFNVPNENFDIYIGKDSSPLKVANTGVFIIKNSIFSKRFVKEWLDNCLIGDKLVNKCSNWRYDNITATWSCNGCIWAGKKYEQGIFNDMYKKYKSNIAILDTSLFSNTDLTLSSYILHLMGQTNEKRLETFMTIYNNLKNT